MMSPRYLPFSPDYTFVAVRALALAGRRYAPGEVIDKTTVTPARLLQLYTLRWIKPAPVEPVLTAPAESVVVASVETLPNELPVGEALGGFLDAGEDAQPLPVKRRRT